MANPINTVNCAANPNIGCDGTIVSTTAGTGYRFDVMCTTSQNTNGYWRA